jgi:hypothetical protein
MSTPAWFTGQMAESHMADRLREADVRRSVHDTAPESSGSPDPLVVPLHPRSRLARWTGQALIAGGRWLAGPDAAIERSPG